ncbi:transposable element Tc1 transposase [Trichonephila clavipes]|nr:transposable element Tc1 transposase [Trichonephila clavipes]
MGRSDAAIRKCWQEWVDCDILQHHDGSGRPRATADQEDRLIAKSAVTALGSSLLTIRLFSDESRFHLCPDDHRRHVWRQPGQRADPAFPIARRTGPRQGVMYSGLIIQQENSKPHTTRVAMNYLTVDQTLPRPSRSPNPSPIEHAFDMMGRRLPLSRNVDDLARQLEQI